MDRSGLQRIIPIILILIIVIVAVAALFSLGRTLFSGGNTQSSNAPANPGKDALTSTLADRSVKFTVRGPIVANENFHTYTITITPGSRNMTTYTGYLKDTLDNSDLDNNVQAYTQFVYALSREKLMDAIPLTGDDNDTRGVCATGNLYEFSVLKGKDTVQQLWTTTCKSAPGSLKANSIRVIKLFQKQIPDFTKLATKVKLNY